MWRLSSSSLRRNTDIFERGAQASEARYLNQELLGVMLLQDGNERYTMVVLPWHVPSGRSTHTLTVPLLSALGISNVREWPVLSQTGDLNWKTRRKKGGEKNAPVNLQKTEKRCSTGVHRADV